MDISDRLDEYQSKKGEMADELVLDKETMKEVLKTADIPDSKVTKIVSSYEEIFENSYPKASEIKDEKILASSEMYIEKRSLEKENAKLNELLKGKEKAYTLSELKTWHDKYEKESGGEDFYEWLLENIE